MLDLAVASSIVAAAAGWLAARIRKGARLDEGWTSTCVACGQASLRLGTLGLVFGITAFAGEGRAADTVEPLAVGATDLEVYAGVSGLGLPSDEMELGSSFQLGYGVTERLSAYVNGGGAANGHLADGASTVGFGVYGTPADTEVLDLDLLLDFGVAGSVFFEMNAGIGTEINVDIRAFGLFLNAWEVFGGRETAVADAPDETGRSFESTFDTELAVGVRLRPADAHELLLLYDFTLHHVPEDGCGAHEVGGLALGYNVMLHDSVEIINELRCDIPGEGEEVSFGFSVGIIAKIP